jgi:predicted Rossmann-fold nucleotide-binding protein
MTSHALVILPGEHGTQNEVAIALQYDKPMILFGPEAAFAKFPESPTRVQDIEEVREFLEKTTAQVRSDDKS